MKVALWWLGLFGLEVTLGSLLSSPLPFPLRLQWLGMALLILERREEAVLAGGLAGLALDCLTHGVLGLYAWTHLVSLQFLLWIRPNSRRVTLGLNLIPLALAFSVEALVSTVLQATLLGVSILPEMGIGFPLGLLAHGLLAVLLQRWFLPGPSLRFSS